MNRRRRQRQPRTIQDFVRAGVLKPFQPTTATGYCAYGTGREMRPVGDAAASVLTYPVTVGGSAKLSNTTGTIACRMVAGWASTDSTTRELVTVRTGAHIVRLMWLSTGYWAMKLEDGAAYPQAVAAKTTFASGSTHVITGRWDSMSVDCSGDTLEGVNADYTATPTMGTTVILANSVAAAFFIGPVIVSPERKSDEWDIAIRANSGAAFSSIPTLVRDYMDAGDVIYPETGDATGYVKVAGAGIVHNVPVSISPPTYQTGYFRDVIKVGSTYYMYTEKLTGSVWSIHVHTSSDGVAWSTPSAALMAAGAAESFDEHGQADPTVVYDGEGDWKMWFDACNGSDEWTAIGYATSADGLSWSKVGSVMTRGADTTWDDAWIHHPCVHKDGSTYYMYYAGHSGDSVYKIGLATSSNGTDWTKSESNPIISPGAAGEFDATQVRPASPIEINSVWYMPYWGYNSAAYEHNTGIATSTDLTAWTKRGVLCALRSPYLASGTTSHGYQAPAALVDGSTVSIYMNALSATAGGGGYVRATTTTDYLESFVS